MAAPAQSAGLCSRSACTSCCSDRPLMRASYRAPGATALSTRSTTSAGWHCKARPAQRSCEATLRYPSQLDAPPNYPICVPTPSERQVHTSAGHPAVHNQDAGRSEIRREAAPMLTFLFTSAGSFVYRLERSTTDCNAQRREHRRRIRFPPCGPRVSAAICVRLKSTPHLPDETRLRARPPSWAAVSHHPPSD